MKKTNAILLLLVICLAGGGYYLYSGHKKAASQSAAQAARRIPVRTLAVIKQDTYLSSEYAAQAKSENEVAVQARVSGNVTEKMITGGRSVKAGQPLYRIDTRRYTSALLNAKADLAQAEAVLANSRRDTQRYRRLLEQDAIAEQQVTTQIAQEKSDTAVVEARRALVRQAQDDLDDTLVTSPIEGRLNMDDVSVGTYVAAGATVLVTVGSTDPMHVQFSMSESEYLFVIRHLKNRSEAIESGKNLTLTLSDGSEYPYKAEVVQIDRGLGNNSGTLTIKASVPNPEGILLPDMFIRVRAEGELVRDALLVPQRSVHQVLDKSFVPVVSGDVVSFKTVRLGRKVGSFWIAEEGIDENDILVVEGLTKIQEGAPIDPTPATVEELDLTFDQTSDRLGGPEER